MTPLTRLPSETIRRLRELDPAADYTKVSPETLRTIRERIMADALPDSDGDLDRRLLPIDQRPGSTLKPKRTRLLVLATMLVAIVALVGVGVVVSRSHASRLPDVAATVGAGQSDLIQLANPLAVGRQVRCGDLSVPVEVLAEPGNAETGTSESSVALRAFLANNPFEGMGSVTGQNWLKITETEQVLVFGQRTGTVGIGSVVTFHRSGSTWEPSSLGGCGAVAPGPGEQAAHLDRAVLHGRQLKLTWMNGTCGGEGLNRILLRTETTVTPSGLHLLLVTGNDPAAPKPQLCAGVGKLSTTSVAVSAEVAALLSKGLYDDAVVPAEHVELS